MSLFNLLKIDGQCQHAGTELITRPINQCLKALDLMGWRPLDYLSQSIPMTRSLVPLTVVSETEPIMGIGVHGSCGARASAHCLLFERYAQDVPTT